jgi:hypothetical protein
VYAGYSAAKSAQIAYHSSAVGGLYAAKATALAGLEVAKQTLKGLELAAVTVPIDADPRVAALLVSLETARLALKAAELALPELPHIDADFQGLVSLGLDIKGMRGNVSANLDGLSLAQGEVVFGAKPKACIDIASLGAVCAPF